LIRAAHIRTSRGRTNRPITRLYPLEITAQEQQTEETEDIEGSSSTGSQTSTDCRVRPIREAARKTCQRFIEWADQLCPPPPPQDCQETQ